jgi:hypothetical protein
MTSHDNRWLWDRWIDLRNGDIELATDIIHPAFVVHRIPPPRFPSSSVGGMHCWLGSNRRAHSSVTCGSQSRSGRSWMARTLPVAGWPKARSRVASGSTAPMGTRVRFHANDIWRAEGGLIREYWLSDDLLDLMQQLGVTPPTLSAGHSGRDCDDQRGCPISGVPGSPGPSCDDTITGHDSLGPLSTVPLRSQRLAFQAECRGFDPRLPLQTQAHRGAASPLSSARGTRPLARPGSSYLPASPRDDRPRRCG